MAPALKAPANFATDECGSIAPIFGLVFSVVLLFIGIAIDTSRAVHSKSTLGAAADAASLAGGKALLDARLTDAQVRTFTQRYFEENAKNSEKFSTIPPPTITIDRPRGLVKVDVTASVTTTAARIAGLNSISVPASSTVMSDQKDIELGLALDVTGSMSGQKIADLRAAAKDLVDILIPDTPTTNKIRIGLAPYAASINAGAYAATTTGGRSTNGCVHERAGSNAFTDAEPFGIDALGFRNGLSCPAATVLPMTTNKTALKANIDTYRASGATAGHIGAAWANYLISPEWKDIWPAASRPVAYGDAKTLKAIVLMTDGEFNTQYVGGNGSSDAQARRICTEAKTQDVTIYTIGFQSPAAAEDLLKFCATSPDQYYNANDGSELREAFAEIAKQLNNLRLTQ